MSDNGPKLVPTKSTLGPRLSSQNLGRCYPGSVSIMLDLYDDAAWFVEMALASMRRGTV